MVLSEPDRLGGPGHTTDEALAAAMREATVVVGHAMTFDRPVAASARCTAHPIDAAIVTGSGERASPLFRAAGMLCTRPLLAGAASGSGFLNAIVDSDGLLRRVPLLAEYDGQVLPSLALAAVTAGGARRQHVDLHVVHANSTTLAVAGQLVPLDGRGSALLRFRGGRHGLQHVSAADVLAERARPDTFRGTIVFVGATALGTRDEVSTPLDRRFTGVEVQATVADNLLQGDVFYRPEHATALEWLLALFSGALVAFLVSRVGLSWGAAGVAALVAAGWAGSAVLLSSSGALISPLYPSLAMMIGLAATTAAWFATERRRADTASRRGAASRELMVQSLLSLTEVRDAETGRHARRTEQYARALARQLAADPRFGAELTPERIELLASLAPLHDIGKVGVPDRLLRKAGALTDDELAEMRKHPVYGREVLELAERRAGVHDDEVVALAKDIVYTHHERWDGSGYPQGLHGSDIPVAGRVMAIVDAYDALRTSRVYRGPLPHDEAVASILDGNGTHFDPAVVDAFVAVSSLLKELSTNDELVASAVARRHPSSGRQAVPR
jgi:adenylate cyclase